MSAPFAKGGFMTTRSAFSAICSAVTCRKSPGSLGCKVRRERIGQRAVDLDGTTCAGTSMRAECCRSGRRLKHPVAFLMPASSIMRAAMAGGVGKSCGAVTTCTPP